MNIISKSVNKYKSMNIQTRASLWYTICNTLQKGISFLVVPIYVRLLTTSEYGKYAVFQSWRDILIIFATLNLYCGVFTKEMVDHEDDRDRYTSCMQGLSTLLTAAMFVIYLSMHRVWNHVFEMDTTTMLLLFAYFIFFPSFSFWSVRQRVEYRYMKMVLLTLAVSVATPAVSLLLLYHTGLRERAVIWGFLIAQNAVGAFFYIYHFIKGKCFYHREYWAYALKFNIPLVPHYLSLIVLSQADRIMIKDYCGDAKAGIYNLAYQVSMIMNIFVNAINGSLVPWTYEKLKKAQYTVISKTANKLCVFMGAMTIVATMVAPEIILVLGTREYLEAVWIVPSVSLSVYFTFCYSLFSTVEFYYGETRFVMVASMIGAALNVFLNAIFIPLYGFIAAGYTTMVCYLAFMVMHYLFTKKIYRIKIGGQPVYDAKFIAVSSVVLSLLSGVCMLLYKHSMIRYIIIAISLVFLYVNRKRMMGILRSLK